jgi:hypothetical protein
MANITILQSRKRKTLKIIQTSERKYCKPSLIEPVGQE